jgi:hypothetical protein
MAWQRQLVATPEGLAAALADLEAPSTAGEVAQFDAAKSIVESCASTVSKRESMLVSISGHTDPDAEGFDARNLSVSISRIEPEAARKRAEEAAKELEEAEAAKAAAEERAKAAAEAKEKAEAEADAAAG